MEWWVWRDLNTHLTASETVASAVGLHTLVEKDGFEPSLRDYDSHSLTVNLFLLVQVEGFEPSLDGSLVQRLCQLGYACMNNLDYTKKTIETVKGKFWRRSCGSNAEDLLTDPTV